jgi:hypothetical protein
MFCDACSIKKGNQTFGYLAVAMRERTFRVENVLIRVVTIGFRSGVNTGFAETAPSGDRAANEGPTAGEVMAT